MTFFIIKLLTKAIEVSVVSIWRKRKPTPFFLPRLWHAGEGFFAPSVAGSFQTGWINDVQGFGRAGRNTGWAGGDVDTQVALVRNRDGRTNRG